MSTAVAFDAQVGAMVGGQHAGPVSAVAVRTPDSAINRENTQSLVDFKASGKTMMQNKSCIFVEEICRRPRVHRREARRWPTRREERVCYSVHYSLLRLMFPIHEI